MQGRNALVRKEFDRQEFLRLSGAVLAGAGLLGIGGCGESRYRRQQLGGLRGLWWILPEGAN